MYEHLKKKKKKQGKKEEVEFPLMYIFIAKG